MNKLIIGLSGAAGSGKSTAAFHLIEKRKFHRVRFAGPLKAMTAAIGLTTRHIEGDLKETPCDLICGKTPRFFMQQLGTEFGRDTIGKDFWINLWKNEVNSVEEAPIVTDDCRFPNEEDALRSVGGMIIRIVRNEVDTTTNTFTHESEKHVIQADFTIMNDGSMNDLYRQIDDIIDHC